MTKDQPNDLSLTETPALLEEEVFRSLMRTASLLWWDATETLKPADLTHTQYNVLRILRRFGPTGASCNAISEQMLTHDSDITRLLDRLEARGLIVRARATHDRRVIMVRITDDGLRLLATLDEPVACYHRRHLGHLGERQLAVLRALLDAVRDHAGAEVQHAGSPAGTNAGT